MPTRTVRSENGLDRKMPNVFERLSKQQSNKVNSQRNFTSSDHDSKKQPKSTLSSTRRKSVPSAPSSQTHHRTRTKSIDYPMQHPTKEKVPSPDTYNKKALMEKVPETIGKDLYELIPKEQMSESDDCEMESTKDNINELTSSLSSISTLESNNIKNNLISESKSEINCTSITVPYKTNVPYEKSNSLTEKENLSNSFPNKSLVKKSSLPDTLNGIKKSTKFESVNVKLKTENIHPVAELVISENSNGKLSETSTRFKETKLSNKKAVLDDDKDICDVDNEGEDSEFYKVRVQTRLVSYENSTLVIRNTSKQTNHDDASLSEAENVGENISPICESLSSCSLQSSLSGPDSCVSEEDSVAAEPSREGEQLTLKAVRSKIGHLMTRGRSILSDVRNSPYSYVPDVKTTFSRFQGVTRRSFQSITFPKNRSPILNGGRGNSKDPKLERDTGFSSLHSVSGNVMNEGKSRFGSESLPSERGETEDETLTGIEPEHGDCHKVSTVFPEETDSSDEAGIGAAETPLCDPNEVENSDETEFSKFFACPCRERTPEMREAGRPPSSLPDDGLQQPVRKEEICSCQQESEFPLEIKDLLDIDYARMWWTITGNFGNILPIDWSKTYTRQKYLPVLNLNEAKKCALEGTMDSSVTPSPRGEDDDEEVAQDLDLHQLILAGALAESEQPVKSAEEVIKEIDDIMQEASSSEDEGIDASSTDSKSSSKLELQRLPPPLYHDKLKDLNVNELNETLMELEVVIRRYSETLIAQLAHRDELEYEKELKNTFISLLLQVQNKRRNFNVEKKRVKKPLGPHGIDPKYLTTVIPYDVGHGPPDNETIQILIKILRAINEDTPTVPTLLTDYILKVLCPS